MEDRMLSGEGHQVSVRLVAAALIGVAAVFATDGLRDVVLLMVVFGLLTAGYAARRYARDALLYRDDRDDRDDPSSFSQRHWPS